MFELKMSANTSYLRSSVGVERAIAQCSVEEGHGNTVVRVIKI
jgi:hypothetical protein